MDRHAHSGLSAHTSAIRSCDLCRFPERELWCLRTTAAPALDLVERNFERQVELYSCPACATLWFLSGYGKYGELFYLVRWPLSVAEWRQLLNLPGPPPMSDSLTATRPAVWQTYMTAYCWHRARVHARWSDLTESELAEIRRRARVMPHSIPVEDPWTPAEPEPDLRAVLERRPFDVPQTEYIVTAEAVDGTIHSFTRLDQHRYRERDFLWHEGKCYVVRSVRKDPKRPNRAAITAEDERRGWETGSRRRSAPVRYGWAAMYRFTQEEADDMRREIQSAVAAGRQPDWDGLAARTGGSITDTPLFVESALARDATGRPLGWWARRRRRKIPIQPLL